MAKERKGRMSHRGQQINPYWRTTGRNMCQHKARVAPRTNEGVNNGLEKALKDEHYRIFKVLRDRGTFW